MNEEKSKLIDKHYKYIIKQIKSYRFRPPSNHNEAKSYILYNLCTALDRYNKPIAYEKAFLRRSIANLVHNYRRLENNHPPEPKSSPCTAIWDEPKQYNESDIVCNDADYWVECKEYEIACAINELEFRHRKIIIYYYYDNRTLEEIGEIFCLTKERIRQIIKEAELILKKKIKSRLDDIEMVRREL